MAYTRMPDHLTCNAKTRTGQSQVAFNKNPDTCPICQNGIEPIDMGLAYLTPAGDLPERIERVLRCPRQDCQRLFLARYYQNRGPLGGDIHYLHSCLPVELKSLSFGPEIADISKDFCDIYNEARKAELLDLKLVCGPGYRKSLEFLVKDYVSRLNPSDVAAIRDMQLGACITKYVKNDRVQATASRAAWLGNDETHYVRKWEDKDLEDLKNLVHLTVLWIQMEERTDHAVTTMPKRKNA